MGKKRETSAHVADPTPWEERDGRRMEEEEPETAHRAENILASPLGSPRAKPGLPSQAEMAHSASSSTHPSHHSLSVFSRALQGAPAVHSHSCICLQNFQKSDMIEFIFFKVTLQILEASAPTNLDLLLDANSLFPVGTAVVVAVVVVDFLRKELLGLSENFTNAQNSTQRDPVDL